MSKASTRATTKYQAKIGLVAKTYKLKSEVVNNFKMACETIGESQANVLTRFMVEFAEKNMVNVKAVPLVGQMEIDVAVEETTLSLDNDDDGGNNDSEITVTHDDNDFEILEKWASRLAIASKKMGSPPDLTAFRSESASSRSVSGAVAPPT